MAVLNNRPHLAINSAGMKHEVVTDWAGGMRFDAHVNGHTITMDAPERAGGRNEGPIPKPLMLTALAGCTGMDVIALLRKKDLQLDRLEIRIEAELSKGAPMVYTAAHVIYDVSADETVRIELIQAVDRSQDELCGASAMMKKAMEVTWAVQLNGAVIFSNRGMVHGSVR